MVEELKATKQDAEKQIAALAVKDTQLAALQKNESQGFVADLEAKNSQFEVEITAVKEKVATLGNEKAAALKTSAAVEAINAHLMQRVTALEAIEKEHNIIEGRAQLYKEQLDTAGSALAASEERAWMLSGKLRGKEIDLEISHEREEHMKHALLACFIAMFVAFVAWLVGAI